MLSFINELPTDNPIAGVHCVPILDNGNIVMVWDEEERVLTTIGGRLEVGESIQDGLDREALEEAGLILQDERIPFACWYWQETDTYTIYYLVKVDKFVNMLEGFEKTGYVIMNIRTALAMISAIEGRDERIQIIRRAGVLTGQIEYT